MKKQILSAVFTAISILLMTYPTELSMNYLPATWIEEGIRVDFGLRYTSYGAIPFALSESWFSTSVGFLIFILSILTLTILTINLVRLSKNSFAKIAHLRPRFLTVIMGMSVVLHFVTLIQLQTFSNVNWFVLILHLLIFFIQLSILIPRRRTKCR